MRPAGAAAGLTRQCELRQFLTVGRGQRSKRGWSVVAQRFTRCPDTCVAADAVACSSPGSEAAVPRKEVTCGPVVVEQCEPHRFGGCHCRVSAVLGCAPVEVRGPQSGRKRVDLHRALGGEFLGVGDGQRVERSLGGAVGRERPVGVVVEVLVRSGAPAQRAGAAGDVDDPGVRGAAQRNVSSGLRQLASTCSA